MRFDLGRAEPAVPAQGGPSPSPAALAAPGGEAAPAEATRYWHSDSPYITHFFTALSVVFPQGEKFFIDSVRRFEDRIVDPATREEVRGFVQQEAHHGHQHRLYNRLMSERYRLPLDRYDAALTRVLGFVRRWVPEKIQLAATIGLEHFTAILANQLLSNRAITDGMDSRMKPLWVWHAVEETEHKAVCFDVYQQVGGTYFQRVFMMARMMFGFPMVITAIQLSLLWRDGKLFDLRDALRFWRFVWGRCGFARAAWPEVKAYYRRDFHPWQEDNHALIEEWASEYGPFVVGAEGGAAS